MTMEQPRRLHRPRSPEIGRQRQPELFAAAPAAEVREGAPMRCLGWLRFFASDTYAAQRRLAGRGAASRDQVRSLLCALARSWRQTVADGLAQALSMPVLRIGGLVSAARRLLNLDQAQVLVIGR